MNIKAKLTLQFGTIASGMLALVLVAIYFFSESYRQEEYYERLINRSFNLAKLLIEVDEVDEALLYKMEEDNPVRLPEESIRIYNFRDQVIFDLGEPVYGAGDTNLLRRIRLDSLITYRSGDREHLGVLFSSRYDRFVILASAIDIYGHRKMVNLRRILLTVFIIGVLISILTARFFAIQAMRPVQRLIAQIDNLTPSKLSVRLDEADGKDEIASIAQSFNDMLDKVERAFTTQRNFIANASHEMRTPLTAISGQLEVLALQPRTAEEYASTVQSVIHDMQRLNRLANRLLLLAQTETDAAEANFSPCRMDEVIWLATAEVQQIREGYQVEVNFGEGVTGDESFTVHGSDVLLKSVVINLLENGCKYSDDHRSTVTVSFSPGQLQLRFSDQGIGIPAAELATVFHPFFRGSNVGQRPGHGIGLSLVQRIVQLHRGRIQIHSVVGEGTSVFVELPTQPE